MHLALNMLLSQPKDTPPLAKPGKKMDLCGPFNTVVLIKPSARSMAVKSQMQGSLHHGQLLSKATNLAVMLHSPCTCILVAEVFKGI